MFIWEGEYVCSFGFGIDSQIFVQLNQQFCYRLEIFLGWRVLCACLAGIIILIRENINELWEIFLSVLSMISKASTMVLCCHYPLINDNNNLHIFGALF